MEEKTNSILASNICELLLNMQNAHRVNIYFHWNLIPEDPSDNKFVDAVLSGDGDYMVTNDKHFQLLSTIEFPKINLISLSKFVEIVEKL